MYIPIKSETNKIAAVKAVGIVGIIPLVILATIVGLFIYPPAVGFAWLGVLGLVLCGIIALFIICCVHDAYVSLYANFSGTPKRNGWL